jgi:hypothetical protein
MDVCTSKMKSDVLNTVVLYSTFDFCNCMVDELLPTYTKAQITYYFNQGHMTEMFEDEKSRKILIDCLKESSNSIPPPQEIIESEK